MEGLEAFNNALFLKINAGPDTAPWMIAAAKLLAKRLVLPLDLLVVALWLWGDTRKRGAVLHAVLVTATAMTLNYAIGIAYPHPRPFVMKLGKQWLDHAPTPSFPSDHMTLFACVALCLALEGERAFAAAVFAAGCACGWARVYLGIHFPLDMLGGLGAAIACAALLQPAWMHAGAKVTEKAEALHRRLFAFAIARHWVRA
jgi:undecaprenyl-diphosphatase